MLSAEDFLCFAKKYLSLMKLRAMAKERYEENIDHVEKDADARAKWAELAMEAVHHGIRVICQQGQICRNSLTLMVMLHSQSG